MSFHSGFYILSFFQNNSASIPCLFNLSNKTCYLIILQINNYIVALKINIRP